MAISPQPKRYGTWPSPVGVDTIANEVVAFEDIVVDPITGGVFHNERRPSENRSVLVNTHTLKDVVEKAANSRSLIRGYGGGPAAARDGIVYFTNFPDFRIYKVENSVSTPVTPQSPISRFGGLAIHPLQTHLLVAVLEDHTKPEPSSIIDALAAVNTTNGDVTTIVSGADFYADPAFSPDGKRIAWVQWNHPESPWNSAEIVIAEVVLTPDSFEVVNPTVVAGEHQKSVAIQPQWITNDSIVFIHDKSGWYQPWVYHPDGGPKPVLPSVIQEEFSEPTWTLRQSTLAVLDQDKIICTAIKEGFSVLYAITLSTGDVESIPSDYVQIKQLRATNSDTVFVGSKVDSGEAIVELTWNSSGPSFRVLTFADEVAADPALVPYPRAITTSDDQGRPLHALYYPPTHPDYVGPPGELPPVVLSAHGGPTFRAYPGFQWTRMLYTSRGWAWLEVLYRGSTGYGKEYTEILNGKWGVIDVDDCAEVAKQLADRKLVDPARMVIRGGSAGGYTVLQSLTAKPTFYAAGTAHFGIADVKRLHETTHKFQSHYIPGLMGGTPGEIPEVYRARSPLYHSDNITSPLLLIHGRLDQQVPIEQAELIAKSLAAKGVEVEVFFAEDEGHGFRNAENIKIQFEKELVFFQRVLGLRV